MSLRDRIEKLAAEWENETERTTGFVTLVLLRCAEDVRDALAAERGEGGERADALMYLDAFHDAMMRKAREAGLGATFQGGPIHGASVYNVYEKCAREAGAFRAECPLPAPAPSAPPRADAGRTGGPCVNCNHPAREHLAFSGMCSADDENGIARICGCVEYAAPAPSDPPRAPEDHGPFVPPCQSGHAQLTPGCEFCGPWVRARALRRISRLEPDGTRVEAGPASPAPRAPGDDAP